MRYSTHHSRACTQSIVTGMICLIVTEKARLKRKILSWVLNPSTKGIHFADWQAMIHRRSKQNKNKKRHGTNTVSKHAEYNTRDRDHSVIQPHLDVMMMSFFSSSFFLFFFPTPRRIGHGRGVKHRIIEH